MPGIYIHIPFCKKKCSYCDFVSFDNEHNYPAYVAALINEMKLYKPMLKNKKFSTIFVGGGTPSVLPSELFEKVISTVKDCFELEKDIEFTVEANPESLNEKNLIAYKNAGVNRLSIGLQSADDDVLKKIGRVHDKSTFVSAFKKARSFGFNNINVDLMHGLPGQNIESYLSSIKCVADLGAEHISSYALILEEHTPLYKSVDQGLIVLPDSDETADMEDAGIELLQKLGYDRYEISNFAKPEFECKHNLNYWDNGEYLGIGLNAHSAFNLNGNWTRWANDAIMSTYVLKAANGKFPIETSEIIDHSEEMFESIMVGLRKTKGICRAKFLERFGIDVVVNYAAAVSEAVLEGNMFVTEEYVSLTRRGMDFQNEVLLKFI